MLDTHVTSLIDLTFANGQQARALRLAPQQSPAEALNAMGLFPPRPTLVIIGGASLMSPESLQQLQTVFDQVLAPLAKDLNLMVIDGGTDAGVIHMMGQARRAVGGGFQLVGVVPQGKAKLPSDPVADQDGARHDLEPNHTHFFLIPGANWGNESPWLADLASLVSVQQPSLTILINGGQVSFTDLQANLATGRRVVVLSGSGRLADSVAMAMADPQAEVNPQIAELVQTYQARGKLVAVDLSTPSAKLRDRLSHYLIAPSPLS